VRERRHEKRGVAKLVPDPPLALRDVDAPVGRLAPLRPRLSFPLLIPGIHAALAAPGHKCRRVRGSRVDCQRGDAGNLGQNALSPVAG
jgi:hypothetical protein